MSPLPPAEPNVWRLPWTCGHVYAVTQGNHGDICGILGNHIGVEEFAWDFGLPMRTPVLAARAGVVTLAATYSPAGSQCHDGCPGSLDSADQEAVLGSRDAAADPLTDVLPILGRLV